MGWSYVSKVLSFWLKGNSSTYFFKNLLNRQKEKAVFLCKENIENPQIYF